MRSRGPPEIENEESVFEGLAGGKIKIRKAQSGIVRFSSFHSDITNAQNQKIVFEDRVALDWEGYSELMEDHGQAIICEILHPLGLYILAEKKRARLLSDIKAKISKTGWKAFAMYLNKQKSENPHEKTSDVFIVAAWVQLFEEPFQLPWLAAMAQHALYHEENEYAFGYLTGLIDQKKNNEDNFLRGKETLKSARLGGIAKSAATKGKTERTMFEVSRLVSTGHTAARASELAFKNGFGSSPTANRKLWNRNRKK